MQTPRKHQPKICKHWQCNHREKDLEVREMAKQQVLEVEMWEDFVQV
jgi:hypothetical protein